MTLGCVPKYQAMSAQRPTTRQRRMCALAITAALAVALAGCGAPAVLKPASTPLPGLQRDVQAARNAVAQAETQAQGGAATGATLP